MAHYIDADRLPAEIKERMLFYVIQTNLLADTTTLDGLDEVLALIDSLQQQPDFPITDEQIKEFLATHPKIEVPEKYKNPDWLWKKQEQPEVDLEKEYKEYVEDDPVFSKLTNRNVGLAVARHFFNLVLNQKEENK